jgi:hypothetical protein
MLSVDFDLYDKTRAEIPRGPKIIYGKLFGANLLSLPASL